MHDCQLFRSRAGCGPLQVLIQAVCEFMWLRVLALAGLSFITSLDLFDHALTPVRAFSEFLLCCSALHCYLLGVFGGGQRAWSQTAAQSHAL